MKLDAWGRHVECVVCGEPITHGEVGRPRKTCDSKRCEEIRVRSYQRTRCARCKCPLIYEAERLAAICCHCFVELKDHESPEVSNG